MRLIVKYNWYTISVMIALFILSSVVSFFLIKKALANELDVSLLRVKQRVQTYVNEHHEIPVINSLDDEKIEFKVADQAYSSQSFVTIEQFIKEQHKMHISRRLTYGLPVNGKNYIVTITNPLEGTKHMITAMFQITIVTILLLILFVLTINRRLMENLWAPFYQSVNQLKQFSISESNTLHFPTTDTIEFNFLIENIRSTTKKATEGYRILKEFTENASHEIQTPLAIIGSQLDLLVQDEGLNYEQSEHLIIAYQALKRLSKLNQSLLLIAKIDNQQFQKTSHIDLRDKVEDKIKEFNELWLSKNIAIRANLSDAYIDASPELIDIMLNNLFSNACKHNLIDGTANIELKTGHLTVMNTGKYGPLDTSKIFHRFYKEENDPGNNGLGLSIIKKVCEQSGISPNYGFNGDSGEHVFTLVW
ncbi:sensor histidine kinase [Mucilaginibacter jinjuensis]|uniref:histidine kinase n=1 Tax=Mucilaginibacter jinjuensis TaxID=1176721 RepID=A0ABY7T3P7_9SPHI|nr:HAMP domain-containing sensor histidine kinase [Mucilaginibacter jinjuensis]WCT10341.1 HAMP domain-containing sensor histidine kinase [Mucilaginibacter jinjuensis]